MSDTKKDKAKRTTFPPFGALQEYPHVGEDGKVRGLGCGEHVAAGSGRRSYKREAKRHRRRVDAALTRPTVAE